MIKNLKKVAVWAIIAMLCGISAEASAHADRLSRRSASGRIAGRAAGNRFPGNAAVSLTHARAFRSLGAGFGKV